MFNAKLVSTKIVLQRQRRYQAVIVSTVEFTVKMTKQPLFSAMTTDFDADIKNFKEILNELELKTHTKNGYKFSPDAKMAAGWWFFEIYMEQEFARRIIESDLISKRKRRDDILKYIEGQLKKRKSKARIRFYDNYSFMRRYWSWLMK